MGASSCTALSKWASSRPFDLRSRRAQRPDASQMANLASDIGGLSHFPALPTSYQEPVCIDSVSFSYEEIAYASGGLSVWRNGGRIAVQRWLGHIVSVLGSEDRSDHAAIHTQRRAVSGRRELVDTNVTIVATSSTVAKRLSKDEGRHARRTPSLPPPSICSAASPSLRQSQLHF